MAPRTKPTRLTHDELIGLKKGDTVRFRAPGLTTSPDTVRKGGPRMVGVIDRQPFGDQFAIIDNATGETFTVNTWTIEEILVKAPLRNPRGTPVTIRIVDGEYQVPGPDGTEAQVYYTNDRDDAEATARYVWGDGIVIKFRGSHPRSNPGGWRDGDDEWHEVIVEGMFHALWVTSYADFIQNLRSEGNSRADIEAQGYSWIGEGPLEDQVPASTDPHDAEAAATLSEEYDLLNSGDLSHLLKRAAAADGIGPEDISHEYADSFGHYLAMMSLDHGVSWFDDHAKFPIDVPHVEAYYDGTQLNISSSTSHKNPAGGPDWKALAAEGEDLFYTSIPNNEYKHYDTVLGGLLQAMRKAARGDASFLPDIQGDASDLWQRMDRRGDTGGKKRALYDWAKRVDDLSEGLTTPWWVRR